MDELSMTERVAQLERRVAQAETDIASLRRRARNTAIAATLAATFVVGSLGQSVRTVVAEDVENSTVTAPFKVVDSTGRPLLVVDKRGGEPSLMLSNSGGEAAVVLRSNSGDGSVEVYEKAQRFAAAALNINDRTGALRLSDSSSGESLIEMGRGPDAIGLFVSDGVKPRLNLATGNHGSNWASLDIIGDKGMYSGLSTVDEEASLTLFSGDNAYFWVRNDIGLLLDGSNGKRFFRADPGAPSSDTDPSPAPSATKRGLYLYNDKGVHVAQTTVDPDGGGFFRINGAAGKEDGAVALMVDSTGGWAGVKTKQGKLKAAFTSDHGIVAWNSSGNQVAELNSDSAGNGHFILFPAGSNEKAVEAGVMDNGNGYVLNKRAP